jgi:hypothetical protein
MARARYTSPLAVEETGYPADPAAGRSSFDRSAWLPSDVQPRRPMESSQLVLEKEAEGLLAEIIGGGAA